MSRSLCSSLFAKSLYIVKLLNNDSRNEQVMVFFYSGHATILWLRVLQKHFSSFKSLLSKDIITVIFAAMWYLPMNNLHDSTHWKSTVISIVKGIILVLAQIA